MDIMNDKLSIKNLLFTKAIPNYTIPAPVNGHKIYGCTDCGDKFVFEQSFNDHVSRKSARISYMCRLCNSLKVFYNRCNLLFHIRSHAFKTATISVTDIKIEPLPLSFFKTKPILPDTESTNSITQPFVSEQLRKPSSTTVSCTECKSNITVTGVAYKDRASHFMKYTNEVYACPVCLFALPSICALKVHLRLHLRCPPFYCPECGIHLAKNVTYPYNHDCEGFKMMRATARLNCSVPNCNLFHPNDYKEHMIKYHLKKVYKCPFCLVASFNESTMNKHLKSHKTAAKPLLFYQCDVCPGRYVLQNPKVNDNHLKGHINSTVFPCWACGSTFTEVSTLLHHFLNKHNKTDIIQIAITDILNESTNTGKKSIYRVIKRCEQCKRNFTYKCKYEEIQILPVECPYKCSSTMEPTDVTPEKTDNTELITCHLCQVKIPQNWTEIKSHYAELHKAHKCLDVKIVLTRADITKYLNQKKNKNPKLKSLQKVSKKSKSSSPNSSTLPGIVSKSSSSDGGDELYVCNVCDKNYKKQSTLENHMITHRDPFMAYQCLECGKSFVVKPTFSKHLLLEHDIADVEDYIKKKQCYNESALTKPQNTLEIEIPLGENQCKICRDIFDCPEDLEKHFRVHGMAFLMKNTINKNNTSS